jgi:hypothetical protein
MKYREDIIKEWIQLPFSRVLLTASKIKGIRKVQYSVFEFTRDDEAETIYRGEDKKEFERLFEEYNKKSE